MSTSFSRPAFALALVLVTLTGCAPATLAPNPTPPSPTQARTGILVMAHGGTPEWDASVDEALGPLREVTPVALAFGMADRRTLQAAADSLTAAGVERVAVVRLFLSGRSFEDQTRYLLGLSSEPPAYFLHHGGSEDHGASGSHGTHDAPDGPPPPIARRGLDLATHADGVMDWDGTGPILLDRARATGADRGAVLLLGHGMGDEAENQGVLERMEAAASVLRGAGFGPVAVETLREDWPEARATAEARIRAWVGEHRDGGGPVVVPFRLSGFGPYAEVLEGLPHRPASGLLPHPSVSAWIEATAREVACRRGWTPPTGVCPT